MVQTHGFHMAFTAVISLAAYQAVVAIAHNSTSLDLWGGILVSSAEIVLLVPLLSLPFVFGGFRSKRLRSEMTSTSKLLPVRSCRIRLPGPVLGQSSCFASVQCVQA